MAIVACVLATALMPDSGVQFATFGAIPLLKFPERNREIIRLVQSQLPKQGESVDCQQSFLRQDVLLSNSSSQYIFDYRAVANTSGNTPLNTARLLDSNDAFIVTGLKMYLGLVDTSNNTVKFNGWLTYNNQSIFNSTNCTGLTTADLETLYNTGIITFKAGNTEFVDKGIECQRLKCVPTTQGNGTTTQDSLDYNGGGLIDMDQLIAINGQEDMKFLLNTHNRTSIAWQGSGAVGTGSLMYVSLRPQGVLVKGYGGRDGRYGDLISLLGQVK